MATDHFDIIQITESWLLPSDQDIINLLNASQYAAFFSMRPEGRGGGVLTLIKTSLKPTMIQTDSRLEVTITKITEPVPLILITFYNPNSTITWADELSDIIVNISKKSNSTPIILNGDFNSPNWTPNLVHHNPLDIDFLIAETGLAQVIQFPTRDANYLDLLFSKNIQLSNICPLSWFTTDHLGFTYDIPTTRAVAANIETFVAYDFKRTPWAQMRAELENLHSLIIKIPDPKEAYNEWHREICTLINKYVYMRTVKKNHSPPWFDDNLKWLNRKKLATHKKWKIYRSEKYFRIYCISRDKCIHTFKIKTQQYVTCS